jgi:hypothetical protein
MHLVGWLVGLFENMREGNKEIKKVGRKERKRKQR